MSRGSWSNEPNRTIPSRMSDPARWSANSTSGSGRPSTRIAATPSPRGESVRGRADNVTFAPATGIGKVVSASSSTSACVRSVRVRAAFVSRARAACLVSRGRSYCARHAAIARSISARGRLGITLTEATVSSRLYSRSRTRQKSSLAETILTRCQPRQFAIPCRPATWATPNWLIAMAALRTLCTTTVGSTTK
jgi:hypothetical protein